MKTLYAICLGSLTLLASLDAPAHSAEPRGQVEVIGEIVTVGDLFLDAGDATDEPVFYAPEPGASVEIGPNFLHRVALGFSLDWRPGSGMARVIVRRAAQPVGIDQFGPVVLAALGERIGAHFDPDRTQIAFDSGIATQFLPVGGAAALSVRDLSYDPRSQRFSAIIDITAGDRHAASVRTSGRLRSVVLAPVLIRAVGRNELIGPGDVEWTEVDADRLPASVLLDADRLIGFTARRALSPNQPLNEADVQAPVVVSRGGIVTIVLEHAGITLTAQGRALENGTVGDTIQVVNTQSSRTIDALVEGTGVVRVTAPGAAVKG